MKLKKLMTLFALTLATTIAHANEGPDCPLRFAQSKLCGSIDFLSLPSDVAEASFILKIYTDTSTATQPVLVDPVELKVDLWMYMGNHGGHGSAPVKINREAQGTYLVTEAHFIMPGRWNMRFWVNGEKSEMIIDVKPNYSASVAK